jgi:hypothetical protein
VGLDRVLDRQLVQVELVLHRVELLLGRLEQSEPGERGVAPASFVCILQLELAGPPATIFVHGAIDEHETYSRIRLELDRV